MMPVLRSYVLLIGFPMCSISSNISPARVSTFPEMYTTESR